MNLPADEIQPVLMHSLTYFELVAVQQWFVDRDHLSHPFTSNLDLVIVSGIRSLLYLDHGSLFKHSKGMSSPAQQDEIARSQDAGCQKGFPARVQVHFDTSFSHQKHFLRVQHLSRHKVVHMGVITLSFGCRM